MEKLARTILAVALISMVAAAAAQVGAEETPSSGADLMAKAMAGAMNDMYGNMIRSMAAALADPATAKNLATFARNYFDALKASGFSEEQALQIVVNTRLPFPAK